MLASDQDGSAITVGCLAWMLANCCGGRPTITRAARRVYPAPRSASGAVQRERRLVHEIGLRPPPEFPQRRNERLSSGGQAVSHADRRTVNHNAFDQAAFG